MKKAIYWVTMSVALVLMLPITLLGCAIVGLDSLCEMAFKKMKAWAYKE